MPDTPQPTGLAEARTLALPFVAMLTLAAVFVSSLHDSMSNFEQSAAETMTALLMTREQIAEAPHQALGDSSMHNLLTRNSPPKCKPHHSSSKNT